MNTREKISILLLCIGLILAFLPMSGKQSLSVKPVRLLTELLDDKTYFSSDQVAKFVITEDSTVQLVDLRSSKEFMDLNIPGSINVPYNELLEEDPGTFINNETIKYIFYSNGDLESNFAVCVVKGMNYNNTYVMKGGLNDWYDKIMTSSFSGDRITARENALFETRMRARNLYNSLNSLPDSLKTKFIEEKHSSARKLDGGCE
jgi:rhodanese-related sulfurtransferase